MLVEMVEWKKCQNLFITQPARFGHEGFKEAHELLRDIDEAFKMLAPICAACIPLCPSYSQLSPTAALSSGGSHKSVSV